MPDLSFLDQETGLEYCAGDMDIYLEVLEGYLEEDRREELEAYLANEDWPNYRVVVHAIKSTSLTIGATALSEEAKALEMAAAEGDGATVKAGHQEMIDDYSEVLDNIANALA